MRRLATTLAVLVALVLSGCGDSPADGTPADADPETSADVLGVGDAEDAAVIPSAPFDWCDPDSPPDLACHAAKRAPESGAIALASAIAAKQIGTHAPETLAWNWEEAVLMRGLYELYRVTGDETLPAYIAAWLDHHIAKGYVLHSSDTCAPSALAALLVTEPGGAYAGDEAYQALVDEALYYLYEVALRTEEGGINHLGTLGALGITLWVDSLFMFGNLLIGWGDGANDSDGDPKALDEFQAQFDIFTALLQEASGFYKHAYQWKGAQDDDVYWGRGNGWVTAAAYDYLRVRRMRGEADGALSVVTAAKAQVEAALATQDPESGLWWTILNRPGETYLETSAAALFAYGMARGYRYGYLGDEVLPAIQAAMEGVTERITLDAQGVPTVTGVSGPTSAGTFAVYAAIDTVDDVPFGLGAVLLSLIETSGLPSL